MFNFVGVGMMLIMSEIVLLSLKLFRLSVLRVLEESFCW